MVKQADRADTTVDEAIAQVRFRISDEAPVTVGVEQFFEHFGAGTRAVIRCGDVLNRGKWPWLVSTAPTMAEALQDMMTQLDRIGDERERALKKLAGDADKLGFVLEPKPKEAA